MIPVDKEAISTTTLWQRRANEAQSHSEQRTLQVPQLLMTSAWAPVAWR